MEARKFLAGQDNLQVVRCQSHRHSMHSLKVYLHQSTNQVLQCHNLQALKRLNLVQLLKMP